MGLEGPSSLVRESRARRSYWGSLVDRGRLRGGFRSALRENSGTSIRTSSGGHAGERSAVERVAASDQGHLCSREVERSGASGRSAGTKIWRPTREDRVLV